MPLNEIEEYFDWLDAVRGQAMPPRTRPPKTMPPPDGKRG
jgi:hypothetical protein